MPTVAHTKKPGYPRAFSSLAAVPLAISARGRG
jgi:hypothetical protein